MSQEGSKCQRAGHV